MFPPRTHRTLELLPPFAHPTARRTPWLAAGRIPERLGILRYLLVGAQVLLLYLRLRCRPILLPGLEFVVGRLLQPVHVLAPAVAEVCVRRAGLLAKPVLLALNVPLMVVRVRRGLPAGFDSRAGGGGPVTDQVLQALIGLASVLAVWWARQLAAL